MKQEMKDLITKLVNEAYLEIENMPESKDKTDLRLKLIDTIMYTQGYDFGEITKNSKESIKDKNKKNTKTKRKEEPEYTPEEITTEFNDAEKIELEEQVEEQPEIIEETEEQVEELSPMIVQNNEGEDIDIALVYTMLNDIEDEEAKIALATSIVEYDIVNEYFSQELEKLTNSESKFFIAYYVSTLGLDVMDNYVSQYTDGNISTLVEFINDDVIDDFVEILNKSMEEDNEE